MERRGDGQRPPTNWYVITGGPGSGKTTLIRLLEQRGFHTAPEHARHYIDTELIKGRTVAEIRADEAEFQRGVLLMQIEQEQNVPREQLTFFDRAIPDTLAYQRFHQLAPDKLLLEALQTCSYRKVLLLDLLPLVSDYARTETSEMQLSIQNLLGQVYDSLPFPVVRVPVLPPDERVDFVLRHVDGLPQGH